MKSDFIAVDWVGKNLYWVDGLVGQILAVKLSNATVSSQNYTVVLGEDLEQPSSLVLLPHRGYGAKSGYLNIKFYKKCLYCPRYFIIA